jgi:hypothetical protein
MFEVTSPRGAVPVARWRCLHACTEGDGFADRHVRADLPRLQVQEEAAAHVRLTGHTVELSCGTVEILAGLATSAAPA